MELRREKDLELLATVDPEDVDEEEETESDCPTGFWV